MPGTAVHADAKGRAHLLGGRADVERRAAELEPVTRTLVHRVVAANGVRMFLAEPGEPEALADLLVCGRGEDQVTRRRKPVACKRCDCDGARCDLTLHVERAATPDLP